jgi:hypothetical protein
MSGQQAGFSERSLQKSSLSNVNSPMFTCSALRPIGGDSLSVPHKRTTTPPIT